MKKLIIISILNLIIMASFFVALSYRMNKVKEESDRLIEIEKLLEDEKYALKDDIPNKVSELENDNNYQNNDDIRKALSSSGFLTLNELNNRGFATSINVSKSDNILQKQIDDINIVLDKMDDNIKDQSFDSIRDEIIDTIFPIGSIYYSMDSSFDPNQSWIGTWEKLSEGYFVEATQDETKVSTQIEAGLPDIIGTSSGNQDVGINGAFYKIRNNVKNSGSSSFAQVEGFKASLGETKLDGTLKSASDYHVYGKSETVQPNAYFAYVWKRIS